MEQTVSPSVDKYKADLMVANRRKRLLPKDRKHSWGEGILKIPTYDVVVTHWPAGHEIPSTYARRSSLQECG